MSQDISAAAVDPQAGHLAPVGPADRIAVLDVIRGVAILGIFFMNIPFMAGPIWLADSNPRAMGWSEADRLVWTVIQTTWEGTQRGLLQFLFGAGLMVFARKAMEPDGPVGVADLYLRRNLWLLGFGLFDIFCLLWPGDILHVYALCALGLFPFRRLAVRWLLPLGLGFAAFTFVTGAIEYRERAQIAATVRTALPKAQAGHRLTATEAAAVKAWREAEGRIAGTDPLIRSEARKEAAARSSPHMADYAGWMIGSYLMLVGKGELLFGVAEAFPAMLIGIALWRLGFIQGRRRARDYLLVMAAAYGFGMGARYLGCLEYLAFAPQPKTIWMTDELARLAVSLGHVAALNLLVRARIGAALARPFRAAGQMAFTLYFLEQIIGLWILYSPLGFDLPGGQGWAHLAGQAALVTAGLLVAANVWLRHFAMGPLEWLWRTLAYGAAPPFRRVAATSGTD
ncbi:DUF418 domain-containing protein [Novosphingobium piscinae]|uniref:DUF418 domain-containing protein n=1 Tax=Novosphingobium piscinae TaxID=1507448 RepID=UPI001FEBBEC6|nr:DUF418 domain-containing protein [Novosphingobium piscinae]